MAAPQPGTVVSSTHQSMNAAHAQIQDLHQLQLSICVGARYDNGQICFTVPIYGDFCITIPVHIDVSESIKACAETCSNSLLGVIPTGLVVKILVNDAAVWEGTILGSC